MSLSSEKKKEEIPIKAENVTSDQILLNEQTKMNDDHNDNGGDACLINGTNENSNEGNYVLSINGKGASVNTNDSVVLNNDVNENMDDGKSRNSIITSIKRDDDKTVKYSKNHSDESSSKYEEKLQRSEIKPEEQRSSSSDAFFENVNEGCLGEAQNTDNDDNMNGKKYNGNNIIDHNTEKENIKIVYVQRESNDMDEDTTNSSLNIDINDIDKDGRKYGSNNVCDDQYVHKKSVITNNTQENDDYNNSTKDQSTDEKYFVENTVVNEEMVQEINECNNHSDDASNLKTHKGEIDNRIKRKMHTLKQNEEKKKKKKDVNNTTLHISSGSSENPDINAKEKSSENGATITYDKKNKEAKEKQKRNHMKEDHFVCADEVSSSVVSTHVECACMRCVRNVRSFYALKGYPRIFVTRLPFEAGKKDLEKYFSKYGKIIDIYVSKNLSNNKNKGFGFVSFEKQGSMDKVLKDKLHILCGKEIVVDIASTRDNKARHLFHLPSEHYLAKYQKNEKKVMTKVHNNIINFNKYHHVYNKTNNIRDVSKNMDNNMVMQNFYNLCPTYNIVGNRMNNKHIMKNNMPVPFFPPSGYNVDPQYFNQVPYQNCAEYMGNNDYYWNMANYYNWNNMLMHNENMFNSSQVEYPYYFCNGQYVNQNPMTKNKISRKNNIIEESKLKYPPNLSTNVNYRNNCPSFIRKLPGGDEWNKRGYKLFVTKLNSATTIDTLRNYFENFGEIIDIYMPNDVCTNRPRGIAFVTFLDNDCVKKILSNKNSKHIIDGKEVVVDLADPETKSKKNLCYS
ncbi:nucleic acid binding protein, putative [Plasmodium malariae]|uniref:Nucleic acid binding protein, putative n=1 Tax=Plasmodium malariae TaxID=5858 RepID=A0A1D3PBF3_PLAMA|nr:nucleic acid binding protein, putative [Plasmodium malariae]SCN12599.1 nucleic acid binding protein, putative [Plasmodium malariae]